jgi:hypothetical protein
MWFSTPVFLVLPLASAIAGGQKLSRAMTKLDFESNATRSAENIAEILLSSGVVAVTEENFQWLNLAE